MDSTSVLVDENSDTDEFISGKVAMKLLAGGRPLAWSKVGGTFMRSIYLSLAISFFLTGLIPVGASAQGGLATRVAQLEAQVAALEAILQFVRVEPEGINGLAGPHWIFEGVNVHVRSGSGSTHPCSDVPVCAESSGLGNLVVGYNEAIPSAPRIRHGTHNLIVGPEHSYRSSGGFVAGRHNSVWGKSASVTGGAENRALGENASVSGGDSNTASGDFSSISGGHFNRATADGSSVSGGLSNEASGDFSSVSGGENSVAPDEFDWAAGSLFEED
jgi:hypothetical protein